MMKQRLNKEQKRGKRIPDKPKPLLPQIYTPVQPIEYFDEKESKEPLTGTVWDIPIWTHDGFWEMDIVTGNMTMYQVIWWTEGQRWLLKKY